MKELTIEQKAKAYDKALERARKLKEDPQGVFYEYSPKEGDTICDYIFPELKESDDERIRKAIIDFLWKEKIFLQEVHSSVENNPKYRFVMDAIAWLEKQGEQKPQGKTALEAINEEKVDNSNKVEPKDYNSIDPLFGKPVDKIEPKFHEGDWVVSKLDGKARQISEVHCDEYNEYYIVEGNGYDIKEYDRLHHLWTIQDAKDGDVLVNWNNTVFIFKAIEDETVKFHIAYNEKWDTVKTPSTKLSHLGLPEPQFEFHPATKEQCNILMKEMADAGYTFDFEKKELKKVDNEEVNGEDYGIDSLWHAQNILERTLGKVDGYQSDDGILEHKCAITAVKKLYEKKPTEWSEEDKNRINRLIAYFEDKESFTAEDDIVYANWLKSLKDRYTWKPSKEQMNNK